MTKFGIKTHLANISSTEMANSILEQVDYIEYPMPMVGFELIVSELELPYSRLIPHGVQLSLSNSYLPQSIVKKIKLELELVKPLYLGEHFGSLSFREDLPSVGYIFPPELNINSVNNIGMNTVSLQEEIGLPLALENPVFYKTPKNSTMTLIEFLRQLDHKLPANTGWLLDISHLYVTAKNLKIDFEELLEFYSKSERRIYELHISRIKVDKYGIFHDSHSNDLHKDEKYLKYIITTLKKMEIEPDNITLEIDKYNNLEDINYIRSLYNNEETFEDFKADNTKHLSPLLTNIDKVEQKGRVELLKRRIQNLLAFNEEKLVRELIEKHENIFEEFYLWLNTQDLKVTMIPTYGSSEDKLDTLTPFLHFIIGNDNVDEELCAKFALNISFKIFSIHQFNTSFDVDVFLDLSKDIDELSKGFYKLCISENGDEIDFVEQEDPSTVTSDKDNIIIFSSIKEAKWKKQKKQQSESLLEKLPQNQVESRTRQKKTGGSLE